MTNVSLVTVVSPPARSSNKKCPNFACKTIVKLDRYDVERVYVEATAINDQQRKCMKLPSVFTSKFAWSAL